MVRLAAHELREFFDEYIALLNRYKHRPGTSSPDARMVATRLLMFPLPRPDGRADR